jgi:hemerythrin-like domain-containing protein
LHVFPPLLALNDAGLHTVVQRLLQDHQTMHTQWAELRQVLLRVRDADAATWPGLQPPDLALMDAYDALYRRHLADENQVAYPAARGLLDSDTLKAMGEEMTRRRHI